MKKIELNYKVNYSQENKINSHLENAKYQGFIDKVNKGLEAIKSEKLTKIVVAHALEIKTENKFNIVKSLENLRNNHPDCYIFLLVMKIKNILLELVQKDCFLSKIINLLVMLWQVLHQEERMKMRIF